MGRVLVAGASGALGRRVAERFRARGLEVRALSRRPAEGPWDELKVGDALDAKALFGAAEGCTLVFSCLGASVLPEPSKGWWPYTRVDVRANQNLLAEAKRAGVERFAYVSCFHPEAMAGEPYVRAHEAVAAAVQASGLKATVLRPTGFFSALGALLPLARKGPLPVFGAGQTKSNPIDDRDLADVCVEATLSGEAAVAAGGPEALTRLEMNALAFAALQQPPRMRHAPLWVAGAAGALLYPFNPRIAQFVSFLGALSRHDAVAPVRGQRRLGDYLRERAAAGS